jgi:hypothetical protein
MEISFVWGRNTVSPEQKKELESNIREEVSKAMERFTGEPTALIISLASNDPLFSSLDGCVTTTAGEAIITLAYSLIHSCTRTYTPLDGFFLDEC